MKKLLLLPALAAGVLTFTGVSTAQAAGPGPIVVTGSDDGRQATGTTVTIAGPVATGQYAGQTCTVAGLASNQESVHPNNNIIVRSGGASATLADVEATPGKQTFGSGSVVLGDSISVDLFVGNDDWSDQPQDGAPDGIGLFSSTITLAFDCQGEAEPPGIDGGPPVLIDILPELPEPPTEPPTIASPELPAAPPAASPASPAATPQQLPSTGSETTIVALFGALMLAAGGSLLLLSRRSAS